MTVPGKFIGLKLIFRHASRVSLHTLPALLLFACADFQLVRLADCAYVQGVPGPEDFALQTSGSGAPRLIVSSQERRKYSPGGEFEMQGEIFRVEIGSGRPGPALPFQIRGRDDFPFHPHGLFLDGSVLYVINHIHKERHAIEMFSVGRNELRFTGRLLHPLLYSPNDLVAVNGQLYVTNDHGYRGLLGFFETALSIGASNVVHFNGTDFRVVVEGLAFANGIEVNSNGTRLYVSGTRDMGIFEYERNPVTGEIGARTNFFDVDSGVDNLIWEDAGTLLVAAHPEGLAFMRHTSDADARSPSEVYRVNVGTGKSELFYRDDGNIIDGSSTAALYRGRLYVSQVFDPEILSCRAP